MFSVDGLISGLDTSAIIEGALAVQQSRVDRLNIQRQEIVNEQTAFKTIEGRLLGLQGSLSKILRSSNNAFDTKVVTSSDEEAVTATASSHAALGSYKIQVTQLAQAHQIKSSGFASATEEIARGSLLLQVGNRAVSEIVVDESNNTLDGLAAAINSQSDDISATVVNDGSDGETPYRLLLTSRLSGSSNEITITNSLGSRRVRGGGPDPPKPTFTEPVVQEALDAQVQIGDGEGAITVRSAENQFDDLFPGVAFDALRAEDDKEITITVAEDVGGVTDAIGGFVTAYNEVMEFIDINSEFDAESNTAGLLLGDRSAATVQSRLRGALGSVVVGVNEKLRTLTSIGISTNAQGKLEFDAGRVQDILDGRVEGVGMDDIRRLFAIDGQSDNPSVEFLLGTNRTQASPRELESGQLIPYEVAINRAATQAELLADSKLKNSTDIDEDNNSVALRVDGIELRVQIPEGSYSPSQLAEQLSTLINTSPTRAGREVIIVADEDDKLSITSATYGSASKLEVLAASANDDLRLAEGQSVQGEDVAGVFRVNLPGEGDPLIELADGNGRILTSRSTNEYTADLQVRSALTASQVLPDTDASLSVTRGILAELDAAISNLLDGGELSTRDESLNLQIEAIDGTIEQVESQLETRRERLLLEFASLESTLAELQSAGNSLTSNLGLLTR